MSNQNNKEDVFQPSTSTPKTSKRDSVESSATASATLSSLTSGESHLTSPKIENELSASSEMFDESKEYRQLFTKMVKSDPQCSKMQFSRTKINNFALQVTEYVSKSIITNNMENRLDQIRHFIASIFKLDFINYYLDDSESETSLLDKYIQIPVIEMSFEEEIQRYSMYRGSAGIEIGKIHKEISSTPIWNDILKDSLENFVASKKPKQNFIATFGSVPERGIECALIICTEYMSEWLSKSSPAPINGIPIVVIYDRIFLCGSGSSNPANYQNELPIGMSVGGDLSINSGTLTCFLKETTSNDIFALTAAHVAFKTVNDPSIISPSLLQPGKSDQLPGELSEEQNKKLSIATYFVHKFGGDLVDGFSVDACLYKLNDNRSLKTSYNSFVKKMDRFKIDNNKSLTGIGDIVKDDNECKYFFLGKESIKWKLTYMIEYPFQALIDNHRFKGEMHFSNRNPFREQLAIEGDSGAPVINDKSELVGMIYGGCQRTRVTLVTPLNTILKSFKPLNLELCLSHDLPCETASNN